MVASKQTNMHTQMHNAVLLVWGPLRLAPTKSKTRSSANLAAPTPSPSSFPPLPPPVSTPRVHHICVTTSKFENDMHI